MGGKLDFYNARAEHFGGKNIFQGCAGDPKNCIFDTPFFRKETKKRWKNYDKTTAAVNTTLPWDYSAFLGSDRRRMLFAVDL